MNIEIDHNPTPKTHYFISVGISEKEAISFDNTTKGHRIIKQILIESRPLEKSIKEYGKITNEWDTIILKDGKFIRKYHVKWIDGGKLDTVNNETWETVWEKPLDKNLHEKLLYYSKFVSDNYKNLDKYKREMEEFEKFLKEIIKKYA